MQFISVLANVHFASSLFGFGYCLFISKRTCFESKDPLVEALSRITFVLSHHLGTRGTTTGILTALTEADSFVRVS